MADAVGSRNIWDSLDRLQSNSGEASKSDASRARHNVTKGAGQKGQNLPENRCAQPPRIGSADSGNTLKPRKVKPREPVALLATMQKKLKINPLNLQQKTSGSVLDRIRVAAEPERPLDLSTRADDSANLTESPLDLSLKRESENSLSSYLSIPAYSASEFKTEKTFCITNRANQCGGSVSISKPFPVLPCTPKKVSPVRPIIGGKPVVTDSNGNIPQGTVAENSSKRNVFSVISTPTTQDIFALNSSSDTGSRVQQFSLLKSGFKEICSRTSDFPACKLYAGETCDFSDPVASVIDCCSHELLYSSCPSVTASCNSISHSLCVPDLVRSTFIGQCSQSSVDACSNLPRESCLNIPSYKFQKKPRTLSKKASTALTCDADKRKNVPLAEVRPSCLLPLTSTPTASLLNPETLTVADSICLLEHVLPSSLINEPTVSVSNAKPAAEHILDSSGSPPKLCLFSPLSKSSGGCSLDSVLLSPKMPILSPHAKPQISYPVSTSSSSHRMDHSHPIYSFSSSIGNSADTTSTIDTKRAIQFLGGATCASMLSEHARVMPQIQSGATTVVVNSLASPYKRPAAINVDRESLIETESSVKDICTDLSIESSDDNCVLSSASPHFEREKRNVFESNSNAANAFMVNSEFAKEVYRKSKLHFHAALAVDFEASMSQNRRPSKDVILKTKYYKLIAQKFGFSVGSSKDPTEPVLQHKSPLKSTREIDQKGAKNNKLLTPEQGSAAKDFGQTKPESLNKSSGRRSKSGQPDVKSCVNDECSSTAGASQGHIEIVSPQKGTRSSKRKLGVFVEDKSTADIISKPVTDSKPEVSPKRRKVLKETATSTCANTSSVFVTTQSIDVLDGNKNSSNVKSEGSAVLVNANLCGGKVENRLPGKQKSSPVSIKEKILISEDRSTTISSNKEIQKVNSVAPELPDLHNSADELHARLSSNSKRTRQRLVADFVSESCSSVSNQCEKVASSEALSSGAKHVLTRECKSKETRVTTRKRICASPQVTVDVFSNSLLKAEKKLEIKIEVDDESPAQNKGKTERKLEVKSEIEDDEPLSQNEGNDELSESSKKKSKHASARSLLRELANSDGYVAEKHTPSRSDNLFTDSRYLTREERAIQMQLMRITKLEVKAEWSKVKEKKENTKMKHCSQKKTEPKVTAKGTQHELSETINKGKSKMSQNYVSSKVMKKLKQKSKIESSTVIRDKRVALKHANNTRKRILRPITAVKHTSACKGVHRKQKFDCSGWISHCIKKTAKKCHGRFRCRWKSGIWKKKPKPSLKSRANSEKIMFPVGEKVHQSLTVDVNIPASRMSLSPCSGISSKLSPCSTVEKANTRDDDVVSLSSSVTESSFPRRTLPAEVKKIVSSHATGETVLHRAARLGYTDVALWCCEARYVDVNAKDFAGYTPLHETLLHSNVAIARYLIHYGADLNCAAERRGGTRPLHEAVDCNSTEMVRLLLSAGADINLATYSGKTVQDVAHNPSMEEFLKAYLADITGGAKTEWHFRPSWDLSSEDDAIELGMDLLAHAPEDIELDDQMVTFECSEKPFVPAYLLRIHKEDMPRSYMLLCDVLRRLQTTKSQLLIDYPDAILEKIAKDYLVSQIGTLDFISQNKIDEIKMQCNDQFVDILLMTSQLQRILDIDVMNFKSCKVP